MPKIKYPEFYVSHAVTQFPLECEFPMHIHDNFEILCFVSGNAEYMVEGKIYALRPGCVMIMKSAETHKLIINTNDPYERYVINFYPEALSALGIPKSFFSPFTERNLGEKNLYLPSDFPFVQPEKLFQKMFAEAEGSQSKERVIANISALLSAINVAFEKKESNPTPSEDKLSSDEIINYINENLFSDISLTSISDTLHISPSQINRIFRKLTGTSVYNYIVSKRLVVAQERIAKGENATVASQSCGFGDYSSFYRLYKKHFGTAPTSAKRKIRNVK